MMTPQDRRRERLKTAGFLILGALCAVAIGFVAAWWKDRNLPPAHSQAVPAKPPVVRYFDSSKIKTADQAIALLRFMTEGQAISYSPDDQAFAKRVEPISGMLK